MRKKENKNRNRKENLSSGEAFENMYWSERMNRKLKRSIRIFNKKRGGHFKKLNPAIAFSLLAVPMASSMATETKDFSEVKSKSDSIEIKSVDLRTNKKIGDSIG